MSKKRIIFGIMIFCEIFLALICLGGTRGEKEEYWDGNRTINLYGGERNADGSYHIDEETVLEDRIFMSMELPGLKKGVYEVFVEYDTDSEQVSGVYSEQAGYHKLIGNAVSLRPSDVQKELSYRFMLREDVDDLTAEVLYTGTGELTVTGFKVVHTRQEYSMLLFFVLLFSVLADLIFYFFVLHREKTMGEAERKVIFGLTVVFLLSSSNVLIDYFHLGDDVYFHINRIEGIAREWTAGNFPARLEAHCMYGMGYPMSIMYPEVFLWPAVVLRVMGFDLAFCLKAAGVFVNLLTVLVSYVSFKHIFKNRWIGVWGCAVYTLSQYRLYNYYDRCALGEFTAMAFLPLICWGLTRVFSADEKRAGDKKTVFLLTAGYMGVLHSHVLSVEIIVIFTVIICILLWRRFFRKCTFFAFVKAALLAAGLSLWYLLPFLDYTFTADMQVFESGWPIQAMGLYPLQLFWFFPWKGLYAYMYVYGMKNVRPYSMGPALAAVFFCLIYFGIKGIGKRKLQEFSEYTKIKIAVIIGILAMFMCLNIFPWDALSESVPVLQKAIYSIQFPYRFLVIVTIALTFAGCCLYAMLSQEGNGKKGTCFAAVVLILTVLGSSFFLNHEIYMRGWTDLRDMTALGTNKIGNGEYLPAGTDVSELVYTQVMPGDGLLLETYDKENTHVKFRCRNEAAAGSYVECDLLYYPGYRALSVETGEELAVVPGNNNVLRVEIPIGFSGSVTVDFVGKSYWEIGNIISGVLWTAVILFCGVWYVKNRKRQTNQEG